MKIMKFIQVKLLALITGAAFLSGCSLLQGATIGGNKPANANRGTNQADTPVPTPKTETNQIPPSKDPDPPASGDEQSKIDDYLNEIPKGKLDDQINQANFDKISEGMSHSDLVKIFDDKGMLIGDMLVNGRHSLVYMWSTVNMKKRIRVTFEKDKVIEKVKVGF